MAATFGSIVDEVIHNLQGFSAKTDALATLNGAIDEAATQIGLDDTAGFSRGVVQVGEELLYVSRVDATSGQLVVPPWGRGFRGTTAAAHGDGEMVVMAPSWPRATVAGKVNEVIRELYPTLFAVKTITFTSSSTQISHPLPADALRVLDVRWKWTGAVPPQWERARAYEVLWGQSTDESPSGIVLDLFDSMPDGSTVLVTYAAEPSLMTQPNDEFTATTGLGGSVASLVVLGTTVKLLPYLDAARLPVETVASDEADDRRAVGTASQTAQTFLRLYTLRLQEEQAALNARYPARYRRVP